MGTSGVGLTDSKRAAYETIKVEMGMGISKTNEIGSPKLSQKAQKYYDQLKKKYANMEFVLVSEDKKKEVEANIGKFQSSKEMLVLIDTAKIEKMAVDESYRKKYEGIISGAKAQMSQIMTNMGSMASSVKSFGMKFDDGGNASFFAVVDKSLAAQKKRIEKKAIQKENEKKKTTKEEKEKRAQEKDKDSDTVMVTAPSIEELLQKIKDVVYEDMSDHLETEAEKKLGQKVDYIA